MRRKNGENYPIKTISLRSIKMFYLTQIDTLGIERSSPIYPRKYEVKFLIISDLENKYRASLNVIQFLLAGPSKKKLMN